MPASRLTLLLALTAMTGLLFKPVDALAQGSASALLPPAVGAAWTMSGVQTDSAGHQVSYAYEEMLENISINGNDLLFTINRNPGSAYQIRTHGDTLLTDIRSAISGLLPEGIDADELEFETPWVGFVRTDIEPGGEWTIAELQLRIPLPDDIKASFPSLVTPSDTMDVFVAIQGIREMNSTRDLDFEEVNIYSFTTVIDLTAQISYLLFGIPGVLDLPLISDYQIINEYAEGLGLVYRSSEVYEVRATTNLPLGELDEYLFTIPGNEVTMTGFSTGTSVPGGEEELAGRFGLHQNYPNPFNPATHIMFNLEKPGNVYLDVYSVNGQHITSLANGARLGRGLHTAWFDGRNMASGIYLYRLRVVPDDGSDGFSAVRRMTLLK